MLSRTRQLRSRGASPSASQRNITLSPLRTDSCLVLTVTCGPAVVEIFHQNVYNAALTTAQCTLNTIIKSIFTSKVKTRERTRGIPLFFNYKQTVEFCIYIQIATYGALLNAGLFCSRKRKKKKINYRRMMLSGIIACVRTCTDKAFIQ